MTSVSLTTADGSVIPLRLISGDTAEKRAGRDALPVVVIMPGLGVPVDYYLTVAQRLAAWGVDLALAELRGNGTSTPRPSRESRYGYHHLVSEDFPKVFAAARQQFGAGRQYYLLGHSIGGQLGMLYAARAGSKLAGLIVIATGSSYYARHQGLLVPGLRYGSAAVALGARIAGFWPGERLGTSGFGRQSRVLVADWSRLARTGRFAPTGADIDYEKRLRELRLPVLAIGMPNDPLAPPAAIRHLLDKMPAADITHHTHSHPYDHNDWAMEPESTVALITEWLEKTLRPESVAG